MVMMLFMPNVKVSDGSQPAATPATPLGVPAGARSLDRHGSAWCDVASYTLWARCPEPRCGR